MTKVQIYNRLEILMDVFHYSIKNQLLSNGKRICITMERVQLLRCLDKLKENPFSEPKPKYTIPHELNEKVLHIFKNVIK